MQHKFSVQHSLVIADYKKLDRDYNEALQDRQSLEDQLVQVNHNLYTLQKQNSQLDKFAKAQREKYSGQEQNLRREIADLKKENKGLIRRVHIEQEAKDAINEDNEMLAGQLPLIEDLEEERNALIQECEKLAMENEEYKTFLEHTTV